MEKELLSIIASLEHFLNLLLGFKIVIHSDHKNLSFNTFKSEHVHQCRLLLEEYDYTFVYTPGKDSFVVDLLSRYPTHPIPYTNAEILVLHDDNDNDNSDCLVNYRLIAQHQDNDAALQAILATTGY